MTNRTRAAQAYLSVSQSEIREGVEALSFSQKRDLYVTWEWKKAAGTVHTDFRQWLFDYVEQRILNDADAANRSYY